MARDRGPARLILAALAAFAVALMAIPLSQTSGAGGDGDGDETAAQPVPTAAAVDVSAPPPPPTGETAPGGTVGRPEAIASDAMAAELVRRPVFAVVIGINPSPGEGLAELTGAVNDANDMAAALVRLGVPAGNMLVLRDGEATAPAIRAAADWLAAVAGPDATAVFSYAGHSLKLDATTEAIVPVDGELITDAELAGHFGSMTAHNAWFVFAACYGGGFTEVLGPGRAMTAAADANSLAYENAGLGRSYLDEFVVRQGLLLGGSGSPTVQEAVAYAETALDQQRPDRQIVHYDQTTTPISLDGLDRLPLGG